MDEIFNIVVICVSSIFLRKSINKLLHNKGNLLDYCFMAFYMVQVVPIIVQLFAGIPDVLHHVNVASAMNDSITNYVYGIIVMVASLFMSKLSYKLTPQLLPPSSIKSTAGLFNAILMVAMFAPLFAVAFSPDPSIYLKFSYFYTQSFDDNSYLYLFHRTAVTSCVLLSVVALLFKYFRKKTNDSTWIYYIAIFLSTWIDGKRTIFLFMLIGILAVDLIKGNYSNIKIRKKQIFKTVLFASLVFFYFFAYNQKTGKGEDAEFYFLYTFYFSRMSIVKTAIYDQLYTNSMLEYPCQTILFNILIWIPRAIWASKPVMYCIYFTSYADGSTNQLDYNLQVSAWSEFISNFGFIVGPLFVCLFFYYMAKISISTKSNITYLLCTAFCVLYSVYGFEHIISYIFYLWLALVVYRKLFVKSKDKKRNSLAK